MSNCMDMINEETQTKLIYKKQKVSYSNINNLFEVNFIKIMRLVPLLPSIKNDYIAKKNLLNEIHLICHNKSPYTGTYTLTHKIITQEKIINRPDICFKIYFDAKLLEVISICKETRINNSHPLIDNCSDLTFQFELNLFMFRWLDYCLKSYNGAEWLKKN